MPQKVTDQQICTRTSEYFSFIINHILIKIVHYLFATVFIYFYLNLIVKNDMFIKYLVVITFPSRTIYLQWTEEIISCIRKCLQDNRLAWNWQILSLHNLRTCVHTDGCLPFCFQKGIPAISLEAKTNYALNFSFGWKRDLNPMLVWVLDAVVLVWCHCSWTVVCGRIEMMWPRRICLQDLGDRTVGALGEIHESLC
jgi:hypothetical protein